MIDRVVSFSRRREFLAARAGRRGQVSVEYMLLLCSVVLVVSLVGYFLKNYEDALVDKIGDKILKAIFILAFG